MLIGIDIYTIKVRDLKEELYNLLQKKKEQEIERSNIFKNLKDINLNIKDFNNQTNFKIFILFRKIF